MIYLIKKILKTLFYIFIFLVELCSSIYLIKSIKEDSEKGKEKQTVYAKIGYELEYDEKIKEIVNID